MSYLINNIPINRPPLTNPVEGLNLKTFIQDYNSIPTLHQFVGRGVETTYTQNRKLKPKQLLVLFAVLKNLIAAGRAQDQLNTAMEILTNNPFDGDQQAILSAEIRDLLFEIPKLLDYQNIIKDITNLKNKSSLQNIKKTDEFLGSFLGGMSKAEINEVLGSKTVQRFVQLWISPRYTPKKPISETHNITLENNQTITYNTPLPTFQLEEQVRDDLAILYAESVIAEGYKTSYTYENGVLTLLPTNSKIPAGVSQKIRITIIKQALKAMGWEFGYQEITRFKLSPELTELYNAAVKDPTYDIGKHLWEILTPHLPKSLINCTQSSLYSVFRSACGEFIKSEQTHIENFLSVTLAELQQEDKVKANSARDKAKTNIKMLYEANGLLHLINGGENGFNNGNNKDNNINNSRDNNLTASDSGDNSNSNNINSNDYNINSNSSNSSYLKPTLDKLLDDIILDLIEIEDRYNNTLKEDNLFFKDWLQ